MSPATQELTLGGLAVTRYPGPGPALLLVHGSHAGAWCWGGFAPYFAARGYDVYALSLRGHRPNPPLERLGDVSLADYVEDVLGVLAAIGRDCVLLGHSLGGAVAQRVAAERAPLALVLAAPAPMAAVRFRRPPLGARAGLRLLRQLPAILRGRPLWPDRLVNLQGVFNRVPAAEREAMLAALGPESGRALRELMQPEQRVNLSGAAFPRLVVSGSDDRMLVMAMQRELAAALGAELIELAGHGHVFMIEPGWQDCARRIADWLAQALASLPVAGTR